MRFSIIAALAIAALVSFSGAKGHQASIGSSKRSGGHGPLISQETLKLVSQNTKLERAYIPDRILDNMMLVKHEINTKGEVLKIRFLANEGYEVKQTADGIMVTGKVWYSIRPVTKKVHVDWHHCDPPPCADNEIVIRPWSDDIRPATLTFRSF